MAERSYSAKLLPKPTERRATGFSVLLLLVTSVFSLASGDENVEPAPDQTAKTKKWFHDLNGEFVDVPVSTRIPRRFEIYNPHSGSELQAVKQMGFTQVILDRTDLHADATEIGLRVVLANWWIDKTQRDVIERGIKMAREVRVGQLAGFSVMDEPGRNAPETSFGFYVDLYKELRNEFDNKPSSLLQGVPIEISHAGPFASWDQRYYDYFSYLYEAADVIRIMPYPDLPEGPLSDVFFMMRRTEKLMQLAGRRPPLVVILQAWVLPEQKKMPEISELRVMAYQALLGGAAVVSFFDYNTEVWKKYPRFSEGFPTLMKELKQFSSEFRDCEVATVMNSAGIMTSRLTAADGKVTEVAVNTNRYAINGFQPLQIKRTRVASGQKAPSKVLVVGTCIPMQQCRPVYCCLKKQCRPRRTRRLFRLRCR